ncbi:glutamine synthetase I [Haematococcus lacustris]
MEPKYLRLLWCDLAGIRRCRVVPASRLPAVMQLGVGLTAACMAMPVYADEAVPGSWLSPVGEVRLIPVDSSLVWLPWCPGHQMAVCDLQTPPGVTWSCCPRSALKRMLAVLEQEWGLRVRVGYETEFVLLKASSCPGAPLVPVDGQPYCHSAALDSQAQVLDAMVEALQSMGIAVEQYHAEAGGGQFEIVTSHFEGVEAADMLLLTRETISAVARKHKLHACFAPWLNPDGVANGAHCHISLWKDGVNVMSAPSTSSDNIGTAGGEAVGGELEPYPQLSTLAQNFLAGVLSSLPALLLFTAPSVNSYGRLQPGQWAGAHQAWGWDNRELPLRLTSTPCTSQGEGGAGGLPGVNLEFKALDASANPHLALAALLAAGVAGMRQQAHLPPPLQRNPGRLSEAELLAAGATRLPTSLAAALDRWGAADHEGGVVAAFKAECGAHIGQPLLQAFEAVRAAELSHGELEHSQLRSRY